MATNYYDSFGNHIGKRCSAGNKQTAFIFSRKVIIFPGSQETITDEYGNTMTADEFQKMIEECAVISDRAGDFS